MEKIKTTRHLIDDLDKQIMTLLSKRFELTKEVGKVKLLNNDNIENKDRENEILNKANYFSNSDKIKKIYSCVFDLSKKDQLYEYYLIGKKIEYSYSPIIYKLLGISNYKLLEVDEFPNLHKINFKGINVTIPYKHLAFDMCDELDEIALKSKVVNTIIKSNNKIIGYNTDYDGFKYLLEYNNISVSNKKVIIIGNGATARTIKCVLKDLGALKIINLARNPKNDFEYNFEQYIKFIDYNIIINATPYGMKDGEISPLFPLNEFNDLEALIDVIYNPITTPLLNAVVDRDLKRVNGLIMLVAQAIKAASLFLEQDLFGKLDEVYKLVKTSTTNIVLIGMPYSGKSSLGKSLSEKLSHELIDLDKLMKFNNHDLPTILKKNTIEKFRSLEEQYALNVGKGFGKIISTGGGIIYSKKAMDMFKKNGIIVFLNTDLDTLVSRIDSSRPLIKNKNDLINLYNERINLYKQYADIIVTNENELMEKLNEYFGY